MTRWWLLALLALPAWGATPQLIVAPFQNSRETATDAGLETVLQDLLIARISQSTSAVVLDREKLNVVLREHQLSAGGLLDAASAAKAGKLIGANFVVLGSFNLDGNKLRLHARVVDVRTTSIAAAETVDATASELVEIGDQLGSRLLEDLHLKAGIPPALPTDPSPDASLCFMRGVASFLCGQNNVAQEQFLKARQLDPHHLEALLWSGRSYLEQGQYAHARIAFDRFLRQAPTHPQTNLAKRWLADCNEHLSSEEKSFIENLLKNGSSL